MKTASHFTYFGPGRIAISQGAPRGAKAGYKIYRKLAPTREMLKRHYKQEEFVEKILGALDPAEQWDALHHLHGPDVEPVIQCFEKPPFTADNWCHRRLVAEWFENALGVSVPEVEG